MFLFSRDFAFASACKENIKSFMFVTKLSSLAFPRKNGQRPGSFPTYEQKTKFVSSLCLGETILVLGEFWIISESRSGRIEFMSGRILNKSRSGWIEFMSGQNHSRSERSASWAKLVMGETRGYRWNSGCVFGSVWWALVSDKKTMYVRNRGYDLYVV